MQHWYAGHPYSTATHRGIVFSSETVTLVHDGVAVATAPTTTPDPYRYWHDLVFLRDFPQISHWYFGSYWTGRVRVSLPSAAPSPDAVVGTVQYVEEEADGQEWRIDLKLQSLPQPPPPFPPLTYPVLTLPRPPFETSRANLILTVRTAALVLGGITSDVATTEWHLLTSLVTPDELPDVLPDSPQMWGLAGQSEHTLRQMWCAAMGLKPQEEVA